MTQEQNKRFEEAMTMLGDAHTMLAKTSLSKEEYQPISSLLAMAKVELFNLRSELSEKNMFKHHPLSKGYGKP